MVLPMAVVLTNASATSSSATTRHNRSISTTILSISPSSRLNILPNWCAPPRCACSFRSAIVSSLLKPPVPKVGAGWGACSSLEWRYRVAGTWGSPTPRGPTWMDSNSRWGTFSRRSTWILAWCLPYGRGSWPGTFVGPGRGRVRLLLKRTSSPKAVGSSR